MKNVWEIELDILDTRVCFCYGTKAYNKHIRTVYGLTAPMSKTAIAVDVTDKQGYTEYAIGVEAFDNHTMSSLEYTALIVHEITHIVSMLIDYTGIDNDEFRCVVTQYLYSKIMSIVETIFIKEGINK